MRPSREVEYCYNVCTETVYSQVFGLLPIRPYSLRRKIARRISNYLNPKTIPMLSKGNTENATVEEARP